MMKNVKTHLNDYLNMNVIKLSMITILNYGYGIDIIWWKRNVSLHLNHLDATVKVILDTVM